MRGVFLFAVGYEELAVSREHAASLGERASTRDKLALRRIISWCMPTSRTSSSAP